MTVPVEALLDPERLRAVHASGLLDTAAEEPFDRLARLAAEVLGTPFAFVTVVDETRSFWKSCIGVDATEPADRQNRVEDSFCQYVIGSGEAVIIDDALLDDRSRDNPSIELMGVRAWAGFPVRAPGGEILGTFCAVDVVPREWSTAQLRTLSTMAQAAEGEIALRSALDRSNELVRTLQESLLPGSIPPVPGALVAARHVAAHDGTGSLGDFYDVFGSALGRWHVVIGDVCGHGVGAAKTTALARWTIEAAANRTSDPVELLATLNTAAFHRGSSRFLTAQVLTLEPSSTGLTIDLASGGHPPPFVRRGDGTVEEVSVRGSLIGIFETVRLEPTRIELGPDDVLLLHTDGVAEARRDGEFLGEEAVAHWLAGRQDPPQALVDAVVDLVEAWSRPHLRDDVAVVAIGPQR